MSWSWRTSRLPSPAPAKSGSASGPPSVNFPDVLLVAGRYQLEVPPPFVTGSELAGVVDAVAADVTDVVVGERVLGTTLVGAFAEQAVVSASSITRIPDGVDDRTAAAFGVGHRTAWHVLRSVARLQPGEELVVLGAGAASGWPPCSSAVCWAPRSPRWPPRPRSWRSPPPTGPPP